MKSKCIGIGCEKDAFARGMCRTHVSRFYKYGDCEKVLLVKPPKGQKCAASCEALAVIRWKPTGKRYCNIHWQNLYRYGTEDRPEREPADPLPLCGVHKCRTVCRSRNAGYCEMHYGRVRRNGNLEARVVVDSRLTPAGYTLLNKPGHPLSHRSGWCAEHRAVAYDKHGGICPPCGWCGKALAWSSSVVDHLNESKSDNRPDNLLVSCNNCNRARGAMLPFLRGLSAESFELFLRHARLDREGHHSSDKAREEAAAGYR